MGSLVAAIGCVFVLAGGVVAFHGWPEIDSVGSGPSLVVSEVPRAPLQVASVRKHKATQTSARHSVASARATHTPRRVIASAPHRRVKSNTQATTHTDSKPAATTETSASPLSPVADTTEQTTTGVGQAVTDTTGALGDVLGGPVGQTVTDLGATLGGTVSQTGTVLANLLRAIKPGS